nr:unnamed protein product [Digitaria exilis]
MADEQEQPWRIPPIVQELAAGVQEPPSRYMVREKDRPVVGVPMPEPIPVVDLSRLSALQNWGLFLAVGHGIEPGLLAEMMKVSRGFFDLPLAEKQKHSNLVNGKEFRLQGYGGDMVVAEDQVLDWCDRLCLVVEPEN